MNPELNDIRELYKVAHLSENNALVLKEKLSLIDKKNNKILVAYKGATIAILAKYMKGTKQKTEEFKKGTSLVEFAIQQEPENIEIRFVRLSIQQNSPKILKYSKKIDEDKNFILSNFNNLKSRELKSYLKDYILSSNNFTEEEKNVISQS